MTPGNLRCATCDRMLYTATSHPFSDTTAYCEACCPQCTAWPGSSCDELVERAKRGHRRGTPTTRTLRGAGG